MYTYCRDSNNAERYKVNLNILLQSLWLIGWRKENMQGERWDEYWHGKPGNGGSSFEGRRGGYRDEEFRLLTLKCRRYSGEVWNLGESTEPYMYLGLISIQVVVDTMIVYLLIQGAKKNKELENRTLGASTLNWSHSCHLCSESFSSKSPCSLKTAALSL